MEKQPLDILTQYWGHNTFRPLQEDIINEALESRDVLALLPTGGGKSVCYQVPAMMKPGLCLVVSPLIALMKDQVENLRKRNIKASSLHSGMSSSEVDIVLDNCIYGDQKFLYVSPERLKSELFIERYDQMNVSLLAVDEAHCISQWGHDFRPSYMEIGNIRELKPEVSIIAVTATATPRVRKEIVEKLLLKDPKVISGSFARENLSYSVRKVEDKEGKVLEVLKNIPGTSVVYVKTRKEAKYYADLLVRNNISANFYHAGLTPFDRDKRQEDWKNDKTRVIVSTNAFGMGIDKPDVRTVIHTHIPGNLESYYQESGRAGRDGKKAFAVIIYHPKDIEDTKEQFVKSYPDLEYIQHVYQCLSNYYRLAVGSYHPSGYDFLIGEFAKKYDLDLITLYHALKKMEEEEVIKLNEAFHNPSAVFISTDRNKLYEFQVAHAKYDHLLKTLLRTYGGNLFNEFCTISEFKISRKLNVSENEVKDELNKLHKLGIVAYAPQKDKPQIVFLSPRYDAKKLPIPRARLEQRKEIEQIKLNKVFNYIDETNVCRIQFLQNYFGEDSNTDCGICDICISRKKGVELSEKELRMKITDHLKNQEMSANQLLSMLDLHDEALFQETLRTMIDDGLITLGERDILALK